MPYIKQERRAYYKDLIHDLVEKVRKETDDNTIDGDLNYIITSVVLGSFEERNYKTYNRIEGLLSKVDEEIDRREVWDYEDAKIIQNGDLDVWG